ncbi:uncharacterized protein LOC109820549 isoform X2 [Asparagus officinalis]|uniref:uncharacterized protein LOC109820549 isoform X2 n=1 Tax=Asparagus officinalis TaxID=4686 RepID=UPI00098DFDDB|nr:uncharacterized protein LOC109820549 isoform X2 [Asparagus officinalis]
MDSSDAARRRALDQAFGESSDEEEANDGDALVSALENKRARWESVQEIAGLWICRDFLSEAQQSALLSAVDGERWFSGSFHNQAMRFGDLPEWATELARLVRKAVCFGESSLKGDKDLVVEDQCMEEPCPLPFDLLWREPLFDQLIVNVYKPGDMCTCGFDAF